MANAESMIRDDCLNVYVSLWLGLERFGFENRQYRVKTFSERYSSKQVKIESDPVSDKKIEELNNLANRCNELLSQSQLDKKQLKELTIKAVEICKGEEEKNYWVEFLSDK